ncbi:MAG: polymer-forming cytoskeletal protein [Acidobacteriota bacterium]|jgi:cytoskeletal protein CcmA (bactofilin family)
MWEKKDSNRSPLNDDYAAPPATPQAPTSTGSGKIVNIGQSILVKGELSGSEDLTIDGQVEGKISLKDHNLIIGQHGKIRAELVARTVTIRGKVEGNIHASEKVEIQQGGRLEGDIVSPRIAIADGAHFRGKVDMETKAAGAKTAQTSGRTAQASGGTAQASGGTAQASGGTSR